MTKLLGWFAGNPVVANLLMVMIIVAGLLTIPTIRKEIFPEFPLGMINVSVRYLGAAPEEVEEAVCVRIEEEIQDIEEIKQLTSSSTEGIGTVTVELEPGSDARKVLDDIKARVDAIETFPAETEKPVITELTNRRQVIDVAVSGPTDEGTLKTLGQRVRDDIARLPGISQVELISARPYEVSIEVSEEALRRYGLTFTDVANAVRRSSIDMPGGSIRTDGGEILLRAKGQAYRGPEFERIVLLTRPDGTRLLLGDAAQVIDGFSESDQSARFSGQPAVGVRIYRVGEQSALDVAASVKNYVEEAQARMPEGISLTAWNDFSRVLRGRLDLMLRNARNGFLLVFLILALFLRFRLAFWVSLGIPISFLGALWLMPSLDVSINLISLFAFIVVLGIVVDDAIIIGENIFTHQQRKSRGVKASAEGASEVAVPVIFGVLTTVAAFLPLLAVAGTTGKIMRVVPIVAILALIFSLIESLFILPSHLSHGSRERTTGRVSDRWFRFQNGFASRVAWFIERIYRPSLELGLRWRYVTLSWAIATLLITVGMVGGGWIKFVFFPRVESDIAGATLTMAPGTPVDVTATAVRKIEESALALEEELDLEIDEDEQSPIRHVFTSIGSQPLQARRSGGHGASQALGASHLAEVVLELAPAEERSITASEITRRWRERTGPIPDVVELNYSSSLFTPGEPINVQLTGLRIENLRAAASRLKAALAGYEGVFDVSDSFREGKQEVKLSVKPAAEAFGVTQADLARQVRQAFYGEEAQRIQRGRDDIRVMVRYPTDQRRSIGDLENMRIRTPIGGEVPFTTVADADFGRGYSTIRRVDRQRAINVTADVDANIGNAGEILSLLAAHDLPEILTEFPGVSYTFEGQQREQRETMGGLMRGFLMALLLIYGLMAIPFRSYTQPLLVMTAIPFGFVGAVWGHMIMGLNLTILSMFGLVALTGVVVNDSIVLVHYINRRRRGGATVEAAVREAGVARFRPILLTSLTTFAGLTPLLLEKSMQARFLVPMAVSLAFGVMFSTFVSLVFVPAGYLALEDFKASIIRLFGRGPSRRDGATTEVSVAP